MANGNCANNRLCSVFKKDIMKPTTYINWDGLKAVSYTHLKNQKNASQTIGCDIVKYAKAWLF